MGDFHLANAKPEIVQSTVADIKAMEDKNQSRSPMEGKTRVLPRVVDTQKYWSISSLVKVSWTIWDRVSGRPDSGCRA